MKTLKNILFKLFVILAFTLMFIGSGIGGVYGHYKKMDEMKTWIDSSAVIVSSSIDKVIASKGISYCPNIIVKYLFQEQSLNSKLILEDGECRPVKVFVKNKIEKYTKGVTVNILINPKEPTKISVANYSGGLMFYLMLFLSIISFIGLFIAIITPANKL